MQPHDVLLAIVDWHTARGMQPPQVGIPQASPAADRLLRILGVAGPVAALPPGTHDRPTTVMTPAQQWELQRRLHQQPRSELFQAAYEGWNQ
jgi:hypothetical protein